MRSTFFSGSGAWLLLALALLLSLFAGRLSISGPEMWAIVLSLGDSSSLPKALEAKAMVLLMVRLPRCLMALLAGAGLSIAGAAYQAMFRNPLVSPDILGVSAGCTVGAAIGLIVPGGSMALVQVLSFGGGMLAVGMAMGIARLVAVRPMLVLVLAGLVVTAIFNSVLMMVKYVSDPFNQLPAIVFWTMGSLSRVTWEDLRTAAPIILAGLFVVHTLRFRLNVLSLGDRQAKSLGLNPGLLRLLFIAISSLIVGLVVSTCGQIAWIGLVIPHIARTLAGPNHERMIPVSIVFGALFMLLADDLARSLTSAELPLSVITAIAGAPLFAYLLYRNRGTGWL